MTAWEMGILATLSYVEWADTKYQACGFPNERSGLSEGERLMAGANVE